MKNNNHNLEFSGTFPVTPGVEFLTARIAQALESVAMDGVVADAKSIYDSAFTSILTDLQGYEGAYQSEINKITERIRNVVFPIAEFTERLQNPLGTAGYFVADTPQECKAGWQFMLPSNDDEHAILNEAGVPLASARGGEDLVFEVPADGKYYVGSRRPDAYTYGIQSIIGGGGESIDPRPLIEKAVNESAGIKVVEDTYITHAYEPKDYKFEEVYSITTNSVTSFTPNPAYAKVEFENAVNVVADTSALAFKVRDLAPATEASIDIVYKTASGAELDRKHIVFRPMLPMGYQILPVGTPVTALLEPTNYVESLFNITARVRIPDDQLYDVYFLCDRLAEKPDSLLMGGVALATRNVPSVEIPARLQEYYICKVGSTYQDKVLTIKSPERPSALI